MKNQEKSRTIKVSRRYIKSRWKESRVPKIILSGGYLQAAGFKIGYDVSVEIENGIITIKSL